MTKLNKMSQHTSFKHRKPHLNPTTATEPSKTNFHLLIYLNSNLSPTITTFYSIKKNENLNLHSTIKLINSPKTNHIQKLKKKTPTFSNL